MTSLISLPHNRLALADLYKPPLTAFGANTVERWRNGEQVEELMAFVETLVVR